MYRHAANQPARSFFITETHLKINQVDKAQLTMLPSLKKQDSPGAAGWQKKNVPIWPPLVDDQNNSIEAADYIPNSKLHHFPILQHWPLLFLQLQTAALKKKYIFYKKNVSIVFTF